MKIEMIDVELLIPYKNNPRKNDKSVDLVAESITNYGFKNPIIIDKYKNVVAGHTRLKASKKLGLDKVPCIIADDLTDEQIRAYRIADNRVSEFSEWDNELLKKELETLEIFTGFEINDFFEEDDEIKSYSKKIKIPNYEITENKPEIDELYDKNKCMDLMNKIKNSNLDSNLKEFLSFASTRFIEFNYNKIAEYYAHSDKEVQEYFEELILVIIDFNKAIEKGFVDFTERFFDEVEEDE